MILSYSIAERASLVIVTLNKYGPIVLGDILLSYGKCPLGVNTCNTFPPSNSLIKYYYFKIQTILCVAVSVDII